MEREATKSKLLQDVRLRLQAARETLNEASADYHSAGGDGAARRFCDAHAEVQALEALKHRVAELPERHYGVKKREVMGLTSEYKEKVEERQKETDRRKAAKKERMREARRRFEQQEGREPMHISELHTFIQEVEREHSQTQEDR